MEFEIDVLFLSPFSFFSPLASTRSKKVWLVKQKKSSRWNKEKSDKLLQFHKINDKDSEHKGNDDEFKNGKSLSPPSSLWSVEGNKFFFSLFPSFLSPFFPACTMSQWSTLEEFLQVHDDFEQLDDSKVIIPLVVSLFKRATWFLFLP